MHTILFRGKRVDNGEWVCGNLVQKSSGQAYIGAYFETDAHWEWAQVDPATIGQYTGLDDRNCQRIFEDDVVKYGSAFHRVVFEKRSDAAYFGIVYDELETAPFGYYLDLGQVEVIGNIHDNPEMVGAHPASPE